MLKTKLLARECIYWININDDIEKYIQNCSTCLNFQQTQPKERMIHHDIPAKPWEIIGTDMSTLHNKNYLCIVDYPSKFPVIKKMEDLSGENLILTCKNIFAEFQLPKKIMSDSGGNSISDKFRMFCRSLNIEQALSLSYHHQSNEHVEACIKLVKKSLDTKFDPHIALLQIRSMPQGLGLPITAMLLFNHPIRAIMPIINRLPIVLTMTIMKC